MSEQSGTAQAPGEGDPPHAAWMIRAGGNGEAEQLCLQQGLCGIGWPDLPDLSVMDDEAVDREIDVVYGGQPDGRIRNYKMQIRHFRSILQGDLVLMPLKTKPGKVAVGQVLGPYEYRPDLSNLTRHARATKWLGDLPKGLLAPIKSSLDRPLTISPTPAMAEQIKVVLETQVPLSPMPDKARRKLGGLLARALQALQNGQEKDRLDETITELLPEALEEAIGTDRPISYGVGVGIPAAVPWVGVHPAGSEPKAEEGTYTAYLFATDGSAVYLSVTQGTERVRGGFKPLVKRARDIRAAAGLDSSGVPVQLGKNDGRPGRYQAGSAYSIAYEAGAIPDDEALLEDLDEVLSAVDLANKRGLQLHPEFEALHLIFKWSADVESQTVALHRKVAEEKGSVWWGKLSASQSGIGKKRLESVIEQLKAGIETSAFLYGGGELVRTRLLEITTDSEAVDADRLPGYYEKSDCNLFVRLEAFEDLPPGWLLENVVLAKEPLVSAEEMSKALGNQTTPLFAYQLWSAGDDASPSAPAPALDLAWLAATTHWGLGEIQEILGALDERGQVILAGPPGTSKTWIADRLARYLTDDQPLRTRTVQLHPSYGYEEFVEGLRPVADENGAISFKRVNGLILEMAEEMEDSEETRVLVIDELNRANIPRVFGELLFLLEYRDKSIDLQFSRGFSLPKNLKVIAAMNTADRSTRSIDVALRRRFEIFECPARADILEAYYEAPANSSSVSNLIPGFAKLNADLTEQIDRHHTIGHSFFMRHLFTPAHLRRTWERQIKPLLEDYFFDREDLVDQFKREAYWPDD